MAGQIRISLSELTCVQLDPRRWPQRILFTFAFRVGAAHAVRFAGPRWMTGDSLVLDPPEALFEAGAGDWNVAIAIRGDDLAAPARLDDSAIARTLAASAIERGLAALPVPGSAGLGWEEGLDAIDRGIGLLLTGECSGHLFRFSKVYPRPAASGSVILFHSAIDASGEVVSRYKLALRLEAECAGEGAAGPLGRGAELQ